MIQPKQLAEAAAHFVVSVALDKLHRKFQGAFQGTDVTIQCGFSGDDIVLKIWNVKGKVSGQVIATPPKKKIILPAGVGR